MFLKFFEQVVLHFHLVLNTPNYVVGQSYPWAKVNCLEVDFPPLVVFRWLFWLCKLLTLASSILKTSTGLSSKYETVLYFLPAICLDPRRSNLLRTSPTPSHSPGLAAWVLRGAGVFLFSWDFKIPSHFAYIFITRQHVPLVWCSSSHWELLWLVCG